MALFKYTKIYIGACFLVCCCSSVTTRLDQVELSFSTANYTSITLESPAHENFIAISDRQEGIVAGEDSVYLVQIMENTTRILAKRSLRNRPSKLHAFVFEDDIYVVVNYNGSRVHVYKYLRGASSNNLIKWRHHHVKTQNSANAFHGKLVVSVHVRDGRLYIYAVHVDANFIELFNMYNNNYRGIVELPSDCTCNHPNCLKTVYNTQGQLTVDCANEKQYLCNIYEEECFPLPSSVQQVVTSKVDRFLAVAIMHVESLEQDLILILRFSDHGSVDSTSIIVVIPQPERIFDLDIVRVNDSDKELVFYVCNNTLHYFMLQGSTELPAIESLYVPSNVTVHGIQAATDSLLAVNLEYDDNTILAFISPTMTEQEDVTFSNETTFSDETVATPETIIPTFVVPTTVMPTSVTSLPTSLSSPTCLSSTQPTQTVTIYITVTPVSFHPTPSIDGTDASSNSSDNKISSLFYCILLAATSVIVNSCLQL